MMPRILKVFFIAAAGAVGLVVLLLAAVLVYWDVSGSRTDKQTLIREKESPDGKSVASIYSHLSAMWRGPDSVYVTIKRGGYFPSIHTVYSMNYECSDVSAFDVQWKTSRELAVSYGTCDEGRWKSNESNKVATRLPSYGDIKIEYIDTGNVATK